VNWSDDDVAEVPPKGVTTTISTVPAACAGLVAVIWVSEVTEKAVAGVPPKNTPLAFVKPLPVIVTLVPPFVVPEFGLTLVIPGAVAVNVNWSAVDVRDVPAALVTVTSTSPGPLAGVVAVICVEELTVIVLAGTDPNETETNCVKFVPVMVTLVPPAVVPEVGLTAVTVGAATYVYWSAEEVVEVP